MEFKRKKKYSIERGFISKLIETKDMTTIKEKQISPAFFTGENRLVFYYIMEQYAHNGSVPTPRAIQHKFGTYELETLDEGSVGTEESLLYWCEELREKARHNKIADVLEESVKLIDDGDSQKAYDVIKKGVYYIEDELSETQSVDITKDTEERKQKYLEKKKNKGMVGIPTGIEQLDWILKGLQPETLTVDIGTPGLGKTWLEVLIGSYAMLNQYKVVQFVTEMSTDQMRDRYETMLYGMMYGDMNYSQFKSGTLPQEVEEQYFVFLDEDLPSLQPLIIETATGVSGVNAVIEKEKPDLVLIDGVYLMEDDERADSDWLRVTHITRGLKKTAKAKKIPIFANSQADKTTSKKTGPELSNISYTQAIGQDADNVIGQFRDEVMINDREMGIKVMKNREGVGGKVILNWDFTTMTFTGIYSEGAELPEEANGSEEPEEQDAIIGME